MPDLARPVAELARGQATSDGAGVKLMRSLGSPQVGILDPFLLLDEFRSDDPNDYIAGFPDHPHRGFETVTYMLAGSMRHEDHAGNVGNLVAGSAQWMTAGRGIIHSEMPKQENGLMWGFQLWVNLPRAHKMTAPRYQDIPPEQIPELELPGGGVARLIAGSSLGARGPVQGVHADPLYLDVRLPENASFSHPVPSTHNAFCYVFEGEAEVGVVDGKGELATRGTLAVLGDGDRVEVRTAGSPARFLLVAGRPNREPIAWQGPFVMCTREELVQAIRDFREGRFTASPDS